MKTKNISIHQGDCFSLMIQLINEGVKVDMVLTDPPYGTTKCKWDNPIPFEPMWECINQLVKHNGAICLFGSEPFSSALRMSNIKNFRYDWVWEKTHGTGFLNANRMPLKCHELIHVFYSKIPTYNPIKTFGHERKTATAKQRANCNQGETYGEHSVYPDYNSTERYPRDVLRFKSDKQKSKLHPTQKPVALLEYLIKTYTNEGDTVLDFTAGSFSTAIACINTNRKFIGIELDEKYFEMGRQRIENLINY